MTGALTDKIAWLPVDGAMDVNESHRRSRTCIRAAQLIESGKYYEGSQMLRNEDAAKPADTPKAN